MLRISFDREALLSAGASITEEWRGVDQHRHQQKVLIFNDIKIDVPNDGGVYLYPGDVLAEIHPVFQHFVSEVSCYDNFGNGLIPNRRLGHYRLASAEAELEAIGVGRDSHYHVKMRAKNLLDLQELYHLIRQGQIWPAIDYETEQVPPPYRHLRDLVSEAWQLIRRNVRDRLYRIRERVLG